MGDVWTDQLGATLEPAQSVGSSVPQTAPQSDDIWTSKLGATLGPAPNALPMPQAPANFTTQALRALQNASFLGSGFNQQLAGALGGIPDLLGAGLTKLGVPGIQPGYYTGMAQKGINAIAGHPQEPSTPLQRALYGAGQGIENAASVAIPVGAISTMLPAGMARDVVSQLAANPMTQAVAGGVGGATTAATGNPWLGMAANMATPLAGNMLRSVVSPGLSSIEAMTPERQRLVQVLKNEGVPLTPAQVTGSPGMNFVENAFATQPLTASAQEKAIKAVTDAFSSAAGARAGIKGPDLTPGVLNDARERIGGVISDVAARNNLPMTSDLSDALDTAVAHADKYLTDQQARPITASIRDLRDMVDPKTGTVPGAAFQNWDSSMASQLQNLSSGPARKALADLRSTAGDTFRAAMSDPLDVHLWNQSKRQYANLMTLADAMNRPSAGTAEGQLSPAGLASAANNPTTDAFAFGRGDLRDLGAAGQAVIKQRLPNSNTPGNTLMMHMMGEIPTAVAAGLYTGEPALVAGAFAPLLAPKLAQMAWNSKLGQGYLTNQLAAGIPSSSAGLLSSSLLQQLLPGAGGRSKQLSP